jgi:predicted DNA-binding transcriptional regulator AlpA
MSEARLIGPEDVVGAEEIAERLGLECPEVERLMSAPTFPRPATELAIGPLWLWPDIEPWLRASAVVTRLGRGYAPRPSFPPSGA